MGLGDHIFVCDRASKVQEHHWVRNVFRKILKMCGYLPDNLEKGPVHEWKGIRKRALGAWLDVWVHLPRWQ